MSPSVYVERRTNDRGNSYRVRYRVGGRESALLYGGAFRTKGDADSRARWIAGEIAAMRVPELSALAESAATVSVRVAADRWRESRIDVAQATRETLRKSVAHAVASFGNRDPATLTAQEIAAWVGELAERLAPGTVEKALGALRQLLDHVGVEPNPARDRRVRLPRRRREEIEPPTVAEVEAIVAARPSLAAPAGCPRGDGDAGQRAGASSLGRRRCVRRAVARCASAREGRSRSLGQRFARCLRRR